MTTAPSGSLESLNPWSRWGIALSTRDGQHAITEGNLWYLELKFPEAVERVDGETFLHLDQVWRLVGRQDRAWSAVVPAPFHQRKA